MYLHSLSPVIWSGRDGVHGNDPTIIVFPINTKDPHAEIQSCSNQQLGFQHMLYIYIILLGWGQVTWIRWRRIMSIIDVLCGNQKWLWNPRTQWMCFFFYGKIIYQWGIFHCHLWLPLSMYCYPWFYFGGIARVNCSLSIEEWLCEAGFSRCCLLYLSRRFFSISQVLASGSPFGPRG